MLPDWKNLAPHRPLGSGDPLYVRRPDGSGEDLAALLAQDFSPVAVAGPMGCGKSTELAAAAAILGEDRPTCLVQLDVHLDMRGADVWKVVQVIGKALADLIARRISATPEPGARPDRSVDVDPSVDGTRFIGMLRHLATYGNRPVLLIDGLEKCDDDVASKIADYLIGLRNEALLTIVVPPSLVTGPAAYRLASQVDKVFAIRPAFVAATRQASAIAGRAFLRDIALRRLGVTSLPDPLLAVILQAVAESGGVPRVFLQLLRDTKRYAALAGREEPTVDDLKLASDDYAEHLERLLDHGDKKALIDAAGTSGAEIEPLARRLRLLVHGLLLEYKVEGRTFVQPAPLLAGALHRKDAA